MKREYMKPYLAVESFQLDAAIAGGCAAGGDKIVLGFGANDCTPWDEKGPFYDGEYMFGAACDGTGMDVVNVPENADGACYQVFADPTEVAISS